jgi:hypothetical protein
MAAEPRLTPEEREAVLAEWRRLAAEPRPKARPPWGCATFLLATLCLIVVRQTPMPPWLQTTATWILGFLIALGFLAAFFLGSGKFAHDAARANGSIDWLAAHPHTTDWAARRRHAVTLIFFSVTTDDGPSTSGTFDPDEARKRLGAHLPYVMAVGDVLAEENAQWRVFSKAEGTVPLPPSPPSL